MLTEQIFGQTYTGVIPVDTILWFWSNPCGVNAIFALTTSE